MGIPDGGQAVTSKWLLHFQLEDRRAGAKTDVWHVWGTRGSIHLGVVKWFSRWRRYVFYPGPGTLFDPNCLRELAKFAESETVKQKKGKRAFPEAS